MPGVSNEKSVTPAADSSQSNDKPSSTECSERSPVAVSTSTEPASHEVQRMQDHSLTGDAVNLANVDHVQTVVTAQPPAAVCDYPGLCPICGDRISGIYHCFLLLLLVCENCAV